MISRTAMFLSFALRFSCEESQHKRKNIIIIHQTPYQKSDWARAFNQFTIACELDMINDK